MIRIYAPLPSHPWSSHTYLLTRDPTKDGQTNIDQKVDTTSYKNTHA